MKNPQGCHTHIWLKKRQSCQNYTILWAHEDNRISFFPLFNEKIFALMSIFCKKKRLFSKKHSALMHIFLSKKRPSSKNTMLSCLWLHFFVKNPCCHAHIWLQKPQFCQYYSILWAKKVKKIPFLPIFHGKITALMPMICKKTSIL